MVTEDEFRALALSLPETQERETWNQPTFRVAGKIFAWLGKPNRPAGVKIWQEEREELMASDPDKFFTVTEDAKGPWMRVNLEAIDADELLEILIDAWLRAAPKGLTKDPPRPGRTRVDTPPVQRGSQPTHPAGARGRRRRGPGRGT